MERLKIVQFSFICSDTGNNRCYCICLAANSIIRAFIDDKAVIENGIKMLYALIIPGPIIGILFVIIQSLQAMGKVFSAFILNVSKQGFVFIPVLYILNATVRLTGHLFPGYCRLYFYNYGHRNLRACDKRHQANSPFTASV